MIIMLTITKLNHQEQQKNKEKNKTVKSKCFLIKSSSIIKKIIIIVTMILIIIIMRSNLAYCNEGAILKNFDESLSFTDFSGP